MTAAAPPERVAGDWMTRPETRAVCKMLTEAGYCAYFVGGSVRNALLHLPVHDIDIATDALPRQVLALADAAGLKTVAPGLEHGTVTVISGGLPHEITTFRRDVETDGRRAAVAFSDDVEEDARRRDFTMNALYADCDGTLVDPIGGLGDLRARRVRFIEDAGERLREDYLRSLRFFRFHAHYGDAGAGPDADALDAIARHLDGLDRLSRERVGSEIKRLLVAADPAPSVAAMRATGVLGRVLPGADDRALAPLVALEHEAGLAPEAIRRLAALGGEEVEERLRLSRAEARRLTALREAMASPASAAELGYRHGFETARDALLLRAASMATPVAAMDADEAARGAAAEFPLRAADLMPGYQGPDLGRKLRELEARWIDSGFALGRDELLEGGGDE